MRNITISMNVKYLTDDAGEITGVFIPISDWNSLKSKYGEINEEADVPEIHKKNVRNRLSEYKDNPKIAIDYDKVMAELKSE